MTVQDAHDRCMKRNTDAAAATPHGWTFDKATCECKPGQPIPEPMCPGSSGMTVQDAHDRCMKRNTDAPTAATPHGWTFDKATCECKPGQPIPEPMCPGSSGMTVQDVRQGHLRVQARAADSGADVPWQQRHD